MNNFELIKDNILNNFLDIKNPDIFYEDLDRKKYEISWIANNYEIILSINESNSILEVIDDNNNIILNTYIFNIYDSFQTCHIINIIKEFLEK